MRTYDRLSAQELRMVQEAKLIGLVERARESPFASRQLSGLPARMTLDHLRDIPTVTKGDYLADQQALPPFGSRLAVPPDDAVVAHTTGGTSGLGREVHGLTWRDLEATGHLSSFAFAWAGLRPKGSAAFNVGLSNATGGNAMLRGIQAIGRVPTLVAQLGFRERLHHLMEFPVEGMFGTPSALNGLARTAQELGIDLQVAMPQLRFLLTAAEPYPLEWAVLMEEIWGAKVFEDYGATQTASSIAGSTCELGAVHRAARGRIHLYEWSFLFEVIDPETGQDVEPGDYGELIVTTLDKEASPIIRYATRDRVKYLGREGCECGRSLMAVECGSISRYDDMLKIKGQNVFPAEMEAILFADPVVRELAGEVRIDAKGRDDLLLKIALAPGADDVHAGPRLAALFRAEFNINPTVEIVPVESLPEWNTPDKKARRFTDSRYETLASEAKEPTS